MSESTDRSTWRKVGTALLWTITVLDAAMMGLAGWAKFGPAAGWWSTMFETWGYPADLSYVIGGAELGLAIALLFPRFASYAALVLIVIMLGALGTVLLHPGRLGPFPPLVHVAILAIILLARWDRRWRR